MAEAGLLLLAFAAGWLTGVSPLSRLQLDGVGLAAGLSAILPLLGGLAWCLRTRWPPIVRLMRRIGTDVAPLFQGIGPGGLALLAGLAGLGEEALFRGVLQPWAAGVLSPWPAVMVTGIAFGALHPVSLTYSVLATAAGVYFGLLLLLGDNLLVPVVAHAGYDFVALVVLSRMKQAPGELVMDEAGSTSPPLQVPTMVPTYQEARMTVTATHAPGTFCWTDLGTTDAAGAKRFYTGLFGWSFEDRPMGKDQSYTMFTLDGKHVAALYPQQEQERSAGIPPHWLSYIAVESVDTVAGRAAELGGRVLLPPFDVFEAGRMALIQDPGSAVVALWEPRNHPGAGVVGEPGAMCWNELATNDTARAGEFYGQLLGWTRETMPMEKFEYTTFKRGEQLAGGMMPILPEWGAMPPNWGVYFQVEDVDASAAKAGKLGGKIMMPPTDIPNIGRFAMIQDPQGAVFSLFRPLQS